LKHPEEDVQAHPIDFGLYEGEPILGGHGAERLIDASYTLPHT
jgi:hypothetical protein